MDYLQGSKAYMTSERLFEWFKMEIPLYSTFNPSFDHIKLDFYSLKLQNFGWLFDAL